MKSKVAVIVDYGMGNLASVKKSLDKIGVQNKISSLAEEILLADYIILPGVGSFEQGMANLRHYNLIDVLNEQVISKRKPFLGICLGMQLLSTLGTEPVACKGLGWVQGRVIKIEEDTLRIPHLGWNDINVKGNDNLFSEFHAKDFYFIHSYHFEVSEPDVVTATVSYGQNYVAAIQKDNITAVQFHPEKSQVFGLTLLKKFFLDNA